MNEKSVQNFNSKLKKGKLTFFKKYFFGVPTLSISHMCNLQACDMTPKPNDDSTETCFSSRPIRLGKLELSRAGADKKSAL